MSTSFEFNAPQFINFSDLDDPKADGFFDINAQEELQEKKEALHSSSKPKAASVKKEINVENKDPASLTKSKDSSSSKKFPVLRKVLHEIVNQQIQSDTIESQPKNHEKNLTEQFEKLQLSGVKSNKKTAPVKAKEIFSAVRESRRKSHIMTTRLDAMNQKNQSETYSRESLNSLHSEASSNVISDNEVSSTGFYLKPTAMKRNASPLNSARKFISLAEQVEHFYKDTPERYRSRPSKQTATNHSTWMAKPNCVPKTPNLTTKYRARKVNFPDREQREEMELEEIKKHQIKANPLNEKILMGPCLNLKVPIIKKPVTVPQPFSLTEIKKKEIPQEPVFLFKAQPVPTTILQGPVGIPPKKLVSPTVPATPQIRVPLRFRVEAKTPDAHSSSSISSLPQKTKVEPFSFDTRMKQLLQKKEEYVKKIIEEEKKTFNSFKAHPMPAFKNKSDQCLKNEKHPNKTIPEPFNLTQPKANNKSVLDDQIQREKVSVTPFKARSASVVHQKPFMPKLEKHEILTPLNFHLNTEKRAALRQKFQDKIKQKEEELVFIIQSQKEKEEKLEREKMLEERKKSEFKANPVPRYKVFEIHGSDPEKLTRPQSPLFSTKTREKKKTQSKVGDC